MENLRNRKSDPSPNGLSVTIKVTSPAEYRKTAADTEISHAFSSSPFGECLLATTPKGICFLGFTDSGTRNDALHQLSCHWPGARLSKNQSAIDPLAERIFHSTPAANVGHLPLHLKGTAFQAEVWRALLGIPRGTLVCYQDVARWIGRESAYRAVANAIAANPVSYLIPCHRVIRKSGNIHQYRWGKERKKALIAFEAAQCLF